MRVIKLKIIFVIAVALLGFAAYAQVDTSSAPLYIKINPEFPDPSSNIVAALVSYSADLNQASITWTLDGKTLAKGIGLKEVSFKSAAHGLKNTLVAVAITPEGARLSATLLIQPQDVDLLIDAKSKTPYWYKGGAIAGSGSRVVVTALPNFIVNKTKLAASALNYEWRVDNKPMPEMSGRGKSFIVVAAPGAGESPKAIELKVTYPAGSLAKTVFTEVQAYSPEVLFYERDALTGIKPRAIRTKSVRAGEKFEVEAVPFFMNYSSLQDLTFSWTFNGEARPIDANSPNTFLVNTLAGSEGQGATIGVTISNLKNIYEKVADFFNAKVE